MALKKLPRDVQSLLCASYQINTFSRAVEELVYNSLDAESTSIAIRIHIQDNAMQVIDNGQGILKSDMHALGKKHMTSKIVDLATLKSAPKNYGYRGESLSYLVAVSQKIKITSRFKNTDETWMKVFMKGKDKEILEVPKRPSQGTTVEIKGYLYNLNIQKKTINVLNELNFIKQFLEQLSLVHNNISISLRDDSKNEIIFQLQKKRGVYQTLASIFEIDKNDVQELQVEKNSYKVKGFVGKADKEITHHWVYLNGKIVNDSKLHKIINDCFKKCLLIKDKNIRKSKLKNDDESHTCKENIPFYFIFITCPYSDYDLTSTSKSSVVEFKHSDQITKLLQKLVQFYADDINLKQISKARNTLLPEKKTVDNNNTDSRNKVKLIIDKILGNQQKNIGTSQVKNGVKGKLIKRLPTKSKTKIASKCITPRKIIESKEFELMAVSKEYIKNCETRWKEAEPKAMFSKGKPKHDLKETKKNNSSTELACTKLPPRSDLKSKRKQNCFTKYNKITNKKLHGKKHPKTDFFFTPSPNKVNRFDVDEIPKMSRDSVVKRRTNNYKHNVGNQRSIEVENYANDNIIPKISKRLLNKYIMSKIKENPFKTTYDLVQAISISQQEDIYSPISGLETSNTQTNNELNSMTRYTFDSPLGSKLTFQSHLYQRNETELENYTRYKYNPCKRFISNESKDNFIEPKNRLRSRVLRQTKLKKQQAKNTVFHDIRLKHKLQETSYTIEFSKSYVIENDYRKNIIPPSNPVRQITEDKREFSCNLHKNHYADEEVELSIFHHIGRTAEEVGFKTLFQEYRNESYCAYNFSVGNSTKNQITDNITPSCYQHNETRYSTATCNLNSINVYNIDEHDSYHHVDRNNICNENKQDRPTNLNYRKLNSATPKNPLNIIFVSKSQNTEVGLTYIKCADPLEICESILQNDEPQDMNSATVDKSAVNDNFDDSMHQEILTNPVGPDNENPYHNNTNLNDQIAFDVNDVTCSTYFDQKMVDIHENIEERIPKTQVNGKTQKSSKQSKLVIDTFNFKDRLRFLPKGMSQIFEICHTKTACDYELDKDYFENNIYNNFVNNVEANTEIYKPVIQYVKDYNTRHVEKINEKVRKDNASLTFNGKSLESVKVLGQVDEKFIAGIMRQGSIQSKQIKEFLVLFDQHAVHERIRLEKNLKDYITEDQWNSKPLDDITVKMTKDEVLYLHNYKKKFIQLGLDWDILGDCEVSINAIPEAILGKNPREVQKVIKAVRDLILEEINMLKFQKGCVSMYPKSIMDLVFSEACRYAIKFGDRISKRECEELLGELSKCKTPFQCAHGRPVMAVIMDVPNSNHEYKVNISNVRKFIKKKP